MKSEPDTFSIDELEGRPGRTEPWEGVRNAVARNNMRVGGCGVLLVMSWVIACRRAGAGWWMCGSGGLQVLPAAAALW
jgi:hypothetical protein